MKLNYKYHTFNIPLCLLRRLKRRLQWVRAAGGIVTAPDNTMLLIQRNGRWDLPKGKVEPGETLLQAALREVEEETGIKCVSALMRQCASDDATSTLPGSAGDMACDPSGANTITQLHNHAIKTYHLFRAPKAWLKGPNPPPHKWHLKQTSWFPMTVAADSVNGTPTGTPQQEEGITAVVWVSPDEWHRRLSSSYGTLRTLEKQIR